MTLVLAGLAILGLRLDSLDGHPSNGERTRRCEQGGSELSDDGAPGGCYSDSGFLFGLPLVLVEESVTPASCRLGVRVLHGLLSVAVRRQFQHRALRSSLAGGISLFVAQVVRCVVFTTRYCCWSVWVAHFLFRPLLAARVDERGGDRVFVRRIVRIDELTLKFLRGFLERLPNCSGRVAREMIDQSARIHRDPLLKMKR